MLRWTAQAIFRALSDGFAVHPIGFVARKDGSLFWSGPRPGPGWHRHGTTEITVLDLRVATLVAVTIHQQRWFNADAKPKTRHDTPPDILGRRRYSALVIAVMLIGWLFAKSGLHTHDPLFDDFLERPARRTLQRWRRRAAESAADTEQAIRSAWAALKPRQAGDFVPGGIPPPLRPGPWREPHKVCRLRTALSMVLGGAITLDRTGASLLAEARRRLPNRPFLTD